MDGMEVGVSGISATVIRHAQIPKYRGTRPAPSTGCQLAAIGLYLTTPPHKVTSDPVNFVFDLSNIVAKAIPAFPVSTYAWAEETELNDR